ncbi:MAG: hypothetical protein HUU01_06670, partial [Saprospiraceae bacterium]|nr:hypothetical protein [Saprospiraceae bacterium]
MKPARFVFMTVGLFWMVQQGALAQCPTFGNTVVVTNTSSSIATPNSFAWAIDCINNTTPLTTITFNIPAAGVNTIALTVPLPTVTKPNATIDGTVNESVIIDGTSLGAAAPVNGLVLSGSGITVRGIQIRNFTNGGTGGHAIRLLGATGYNIEDNTLYGNRIGIGTASTTLNVDITGNTIGLDGAGLPDGNSGGGIVFPLPVMGFNIANNTIAHNGAGITIPSGSTVLVTQNSMYCNTGAGIARTDGPTVPGITLANTQLIRGTATAGHLVEVFEYDPTGCGSAALCQGRRFLGAVTVPANGIWTLNLTAANPVTPGNFATATATQAGTNTSRFAGCLAIQNCNNFTASISVNPIDCNGDSNGSLMAVPAGSSGTFTYAWSNGGTTQTISGLGPGTYSVVVTDAAGCTATAVATLSNPPPMTLNFSTTQVQCSGAADGSATALPGGGVPGYGYQWNNGQTTPTINNLGPGTYFVTVNDSSPCRIFGNVTITEPLPLTLNVATTNETSFNADDGTATATAGGGTGPYEYLWSNGGDTGTITDLPPGTYTVTVTDANGCTIEGTGTVSPFVCGAFSVDITANNPLCNGEASGSATAIPTGGTSPYDYSWNTGAMTPTITGLSVGIFSVTVTDANNCPASQSTTLTSPPAILQSMSSTDETMFEGNDGTATVTASGGTGALSYNWSNGGTTPTIVNLAPGTYSVTVMDVNGCTRVGTTTVAPIVCPGFTIAVNTLNVSCNGNADGIATAIPPALGGPYSYLWSTGAMTPDISNLPPGTYTVTVSNAVGCPEEASGVITQPGPIQLQVTTTDETALGANDGTATATASGGNGNFSYNWSNNGSTPTITDLAPGTYSVTVTDLNGCTRTGSAVVASFSCAGFSVGISNVTPVLCHGETTGGATANVSGGGGPWDYTWSNGTLSSVLSNVGAGTYSVTVENAGGCTDIASVTINEPSALELDCAEDAAVSQPGGSDGQGRVEIAGGTANYSISYTGPASGQINNVLPGVTFLPGLSAGNYAVTITDGNGCVQTCGFTINAANCSLSIDSITVTPVSCFGGTDGALAVHPGNGAGNLIFTWNNPVLNGQQNPAGLNAGSYSVTVTDAAGCTTSAGAVINQPSELIVVVTSTPETTLGANDGTATANASGGATPYHYVWSNGATTPGLVNLAPGVYTVTVTSIAGGANICPVVVSTTIASGGMGGGGCSALPAYALSVPEEVCEDASFRLEAEDLFPSPAVRYVWLLPTGDSVITTQPFVNLVAYSSAFSGEYFVLRDSLGCRSVPLGAAPMTVLGFPEGAVFAGMDTVVCNTSNAQLNALPLTSGIGAWRSLGSATLENVAHTISSASNLQAGVNQFVWEVYIEGCSKAVADTVTLFLERSPMLGDDRFRLQFAQEVLVMEVLLNDNLAGLKDTVMFLLNEPEEGELEFLEATNRFRYRVDEGFRGTVAFQYVVCPPESICQLPCDTATVTIEVFNQPSVSEGLIVNDPGRNGFMEITGIGGFSRVEIQVV